MIETDIEQVRSIRMALMIGLHSFGEIERLDNEWGIQTEIAGKELPEGLRPLHPTGGADTVSCFADALSALDSLEDQVRNSKEQ